MSQLKAKKARNLLIITNILNRLVKKIGKTLMKSSHFNPLMIREIQINSNNNQLSKVLMK